MRLNNADSHIKFPCDLHVIANIYRKFSFKCLFLVQKRSTGRARCCFNKMRSNEVPVWPLCMSTFHQIPPDRGFAMLIKWRGPRYTGRSLLGYRVPFSLSLSLSRLRFHMRSPMRIALGRSRRKQIIIGINSPTE